MGQSFPDWTRTLTSAVCVGLARRAWSVYMLSTCVQTVSAWMMEFYEHRDPSSQLPRPCQGTYILFPHESQLV